MNFTSFTIIQNPETSRNFWLSLKRRITEKCYEKFAWMNALIKICHNNDDNYKDEIVKLVFKNHSLILSAVVFLHMKQTAKCPE